MVKLNPDDVKVIERVLNNKRVSEVIVKIERGEPVIISFKRKKESQ